MTYTSTQLSGSTFTDRADVWVVYDQDCPFCSRFVMMYRLREQGLRVHLVDARSDHPLVAIVRARNLDLNEGMVVCWQGKFHHGAEAMHLLGVLGGGKSVFNRINRAIFANPTRARVLYPWLVRGRALTLRLLGRKLIEEP